MNFKLENHVLVFLTAILFFCLYNKMFEGNQVEGMNKHVGQCCWPGECSEGLSCSLFPPNWKEDSSRKLECNFHGGLPFFSGIGMCIKDS